MSNISTVKDFINLLSEMDGDDLVAIPFIWTKEDMLDLYGEDTVVTDENWNAIIQAYTNDDYFCEISINTLIDTAAFVLGDYPE
jgi:hypothetical protein